MTKLAFQTPAARFSMLVVVDASTAKAGAEAQRTASGSAASPSDPMPVNRLMVPTGPLHYVVATVSNTDILTVSKEKLKINVLQTLDRPDEEVQTKVAQQLLRIAEASPDGLAELDPVSDMRINNLEFIENWGRKKQLEYVGLDPTLRPCPSALFCFGGCYCGWYRMGVCCGVVG